MKGNQELKLSFEDIQRKLSNKLSEALYEIFIIMM